MTTTKFLCMTICLALFSINSTLATPLTLREKKLTRHFNQEVLATYAKASQFFQADWNRDSAKLVELISYLRQNERYTGNFDCNCKAYAYVGKYKGDKLSNTRRALIQQVLQVHDANVQVCILEINDGTSAFSYLGGDVFLNWKTINKLTDAEFVALLSHEVGHRYAHRATQTDKEEELFADAVAVWTLERLGLNSNAAVTLFEHLPGKNGGATHPSHRERQAHVSQLARAWETTSSVAANTVGQ